MIQKLYYNKPLHRSNSLLYDFDEYEDFVPGSPFLIKGSINLKK